MIRYAAVAITVGLAVAVLGAAVALGSPGSVPVQAATTSGRWIDHACWDCIVTLQATDDVVWAGTESAGVVRHDLHSGAVTQFGLNEGLGGRGVHFLAMAPDGVLWAITGVSMVTSRPSSVSRLDGATWTSLGSEAGLPEGRVFDIWPESGGTAWVATEAGLLHFDGRRWQAEALPRMPDGAVAPAQAVTVTPRGDVLAANDAGLFRKADSSWLPVSTDGLPAATIWRLRGDDAGRLWANVGTGAGRLDLEGGQSWEFDELGLADTRSLGRQIEITDDGAVWLFNGGSMWRYEGTQWSAVSESVAPPSGTWPVASGVSPSGRIWTGDISQGLAVWDGTTWVPHRAGRGPTNLIALAITADADDNIWSGFFQGSSRDNLVNSFDGTNWSRHGVAEGMISSEGSLFGVLQTAIDAGDDGSVWVGVDEVGIARHDASGWTTTTITDVVGAVSRVHVVESDDRNGAWIGTSAGAAHFDGASWSRFSQADGLPSDRVTAVAVEHSPDGDVVWFGTDAGAARWDGVRMQVFTTADGIASNDVDAIDIDSEGNVWFASNTADQGVTRFDGRDWRVYTTSDGLAADSAWAIVADPRGGVWVAPAGEDSGIGVSRFDGTQWRVYTTADGLIADDPFDVAIDSRGHVWFATIGGISEFRPEEAPSTPSPTAPPPPSAVYLPRTERR